MMDARLNQLILPAGFIGAAYVLDRFYGDPRRPGRASGARDEVPQNLGLWQPIRQGYVWQSTHGPEYRITRRGPAGYMLRVWEAGKAGRYLNQYGEVVRFPLTFREPYMAMKPASVHHMRTYHSAPRRRPRGLGFGLRAEGNAPAVRVRPSIERVGSLRFGPQTWWTVTVDGAGDIARYPEDLRGKYWAGRHAQRVGELLQEGASIRDANIATSRELERDGYRP